MRVLALNEGNILSFHSLAIIAKTGDKGISAHKLSDLTNCSRHHLFKILETLGRAGFIYSTRGPLGGYCLKKPADEIYLIDVFEAISGKIDYDDICEIEKKDPIHRLIYDNMCKELSQKFIDYLAKTTVADLQDKVKLSL